MSQNLNLSLLGKYANSSGQLATSGISGLPLANGGTGNSNFISHAGAVVYASSSTTLDDNGGGGTSGYYLKYNNTSAPTWGAVSGGAMTLLKTTFMSGSSQYITPSGSSLSSYKFIFLFFNNVTISGSGTFSMGSATLYPSQGGFNTNGLYGGFVIDMNSGIAAGTIGRTGGSDYAFASTGSTNISTAPSGLLFFNGANLFTGGYVYCYGQT